jgi:hypothetical protein
MTGNYLSGPWFLHFDNAPIPIRFRVRPIHTSPAPHARGRHGRQVSRPQQNPPDRSSDEFPDPELYRTPDAVAVKFFPAKPGQPGNSGHQKNHGQKFPGPLNSLSRRIFSGRNRWDPEYFFNHAKIAAIFFFIAGPRHANHRTRHHPGYTRTTATWHRNGHFSDVKTNISLYDHDTPSVPRFTRAPY